MTAKLTEVPTQRFVDNLTSITPGALRGGLRVRGPASPSATRCWSAARTVVPQIYQVFRQVARKIGDNATLLRKFPEMEGRIFGVDYSPDGSDHRRRAPAWTARGAIHLFCVPVRSRRSRTSGAEGVRKDQRRVFAKAEREAIEQFTTADVKALHTTRLPQIPPSTPSASVPMANASPPAPAPASSSSSTPPPAASTSSFPSPRIPIRNRPGTLMSTLASHPAPGGPPGHLRTPRPSWAPSRPEAASSPVKARASPLPV
jgi:hypothetical protein